MHGLTPLIERSLLPPATTDDSIFSYGIFLFTYF